MAVSTVEERWARAEATIKVGDAKRIRRTPGVVIGILAGLIVAVGVTAATDLRRLQSPRGASLAWTEAAVFGECRAYVALSRPVDLTRESRSEKALCRDLRRATEQARAESTRIRVTTGAVERAGDRARVEVQVRRPEGVASVRLSLVLEGDDWRVLRDAATCEAIGCA